MRCNLYTLILSVVIGVCAFGQDTWAMYSPSMGRFMQRDPIGYVDGPDVYQYVRSNPIKYTDPTGLEAKKPSTTCTINGQAVELVFDGKTLSGVGQSYTAASGRPANTRTEERMDLGQNFTWPIFVHQQFLYTPHEQKLNNSGPTKEGSYWISNCETASAKNAWRHNPLHPANAGWGQYSWPLNPEPGTDMSGYNGPRSNFFIHGGVVFGSAGCIDISGNDANFFKNVIEKLDQASKCECCSIKVTVKYAVQMNTITTEGVAGGGGI